MFCGRRVLNPAESQSHAVQSCRSLSWNLKMSFPHFCLDFPQCPYEIWGTAKGLSFVTSVMGEFGQRERSIFTMQQQLAKQIQNISLSWEQIWLPRVIIYEYVKKAADVFWITHEIEQLVIPLVLTYILLADNLQYASSGQITLTKRDWEKDACAS